MALTLVDDQQQRLNILKNYADLLVSQKRWDDLLPLAIEALELLPNDSTSSNVMKRL